MKATPFTGAAACGSPWMSEAVTVTAFQRRTARAVSTVVDDRRIWVIAEADSDKECYL